MKLTAHIKPNSKHREGVVASEDGSYVIYTKSPAVEGKANLDATKLLAEHLDIPKNRVKLIRGHSARLKVFEIDGPVVLS